MTTRVYIVAAHFETGPPEPGDLPAERIFIHAADVPELWAETESVTIPDVGRAVGFSLVRPLNLGFERIVGTVERKVAKGTHQSG
jgi:hypothetical protein